MYVNVVFSAFITKAAHPQYSVHWLCELALYYLIVHFYSFIFDAHEAEAAY